jgi:hypothetical protein
VDDDPGWPPLWKSAVGMLWPGMNARRAMRADDGLLALRAIFASFCLAIAALFVVCLVVTAGADRSSPGMATALVVAWGVASLVVAQVVPKPLSCDRLGDSYRTRFFVRLAFHESAALVAFVAAVVTGHPELYLLGALSTAIGFARTAPTRGNLERDQQELHLGGCARSLVAAVRVPTRRT